MLCYRVDIGTFLLLLLLRSLLFLCSSKQRKNKAHYQRIWVIAPEMEVTKKGRSKRLAEETGGSSTVLSALQPFPL